MKTIVSLLLIFLIFFNLSITAEENINHKIPRFVSTKFNESNLRIGASIDYPIKLTYFLENFPLKIIGEYEFWREVVDIDGNQGWMKKNLLKNKRYGIIKTTHNQKAQIYNKPKGSIIGKIGNRNIVKINKCFDLWCFISFDKYKGWINKTNIWGVNKNENFNMPFYQLIINLYWKII